MTNFVLTPISFRNITALKLANAIADGIHEVMPQSTITKIPIIDGGPGSVDSFIYVHQGIRITEEIQCVKNQRVSIRYGLIPKQKIAIIEIASLFKNALSLTSNPLQITSYGIGELLQASLKYEIEYVVLAVDESYIWDGGIGLAQALGVKFYTKNNKKLLPGVAGLFEIHGIDFSNLDSRWEKVCFIVLSSNHLPLLGKDGFIHNYSKKIASVKHLSNALEKGMENYLTHLEKAIGRNLDGKIGAGAGIALPLLAFGNTKFVDALEWGLENCGFFNYLTKADFIILTAESLESPSGELSLKIAKISKKQRVPVIGLYFTLNPSLYHKHSAEIDVSLAIFHHPFQQHLLEEEVLEMYSFSSHQLTRLLLFKDFQREVFLCL